MMPTNCELLNNLVSPMFQHPPPPSRTRMHAMTNLDFSDHFARPLASQKEDDGKEQHKIWRHSLSHSTLATDPMHHHPPQSSNLFHTPYYWVDDTQSGKVVRTKRKSITRKCQTHLVQAESKSLGSLTIRGSDSEESWPRGGSQTLAMPFVNLESSLMLWLSVALEDHCSAGSTFNKGQVFKICDCQ